MILARRRFLIGVASGLAMPAIVRASSLMKARTPKLTDIEAPFTTTPEHAKLIGARMMPSAFTPGIYGPFHVGDLISIGDGDDARMYCVTEVVNDSVVDWSPLA